MALSLWTTTLIFIVVAHEIFKNIAPSHTTYELGHDGNAFGNAPWNDSHRKISNKDSFNSVIYEKVLLTRDVLFDFETYAKLTVGNFSRSFLSVLKGTSSYFCDITKYSRSKF